MLKRNICSYVYDTNDNACVVYAYCFIIISACSIQNFQRTNVETLYFGRGYTFKGFSTIQLPYNDIAKRQAAY